MEEMNPAVKRSGWKPPKDTGLWGTADRVSEQVGRRPAGLLEASCSLLCYTKEAEASCSLFLFDKAPNDRGSWVRLSAEGQTMGLYHLKSSDRAAIVQEPTVLRCD